MCMCTCCNRSTDNEYRNNQKERRKSDTNDRVFPFAPFAFSSLLSSLRERRGGALTVLKHLTLRPLQPPIALILAFVMALLWWLVLVVCCCRVLMW